MKHKIASLIPLLALAAGAVPAQGQTDSITLNIPHIQQEATQLCWAALASQVLFQNAPEMRPGQCDLVNMLNESQGRPADCCSDLNQPHCNRPANDNDLVALITRFGMKAERTEVPRTPEEVYNYLKSGRVLLLSFMTTATDSHIYLVRGLVWENGLPVLVINDSYYSSSMKIPFYEAQPTWRTAIVVG